MLYLLNFGYLLFLSTLFSTKEEMGSEALG